MRRPATLPWDKSPKKPALPGWIILNFLLAAAVLVIALHKSQKNRAPIEGLSVVVATVDGRPVFARDLLSAAQLTRPLPDAKTLRQALEHLIRVEVVAGKVPPRQTNSSYPGLDSLRETLAHQFANADAEKSALDDAGLTEDTLRARLIRQLQVANWLRDQARAQPDEAECRAWFAAHLELAAQPEVAQATHFAAIYPPRATPEEKLEKHMLIQDAETRLREGISFPQLIDAFSDDPAKKTSHGSLDWFRRDRMESALIQAAFDQPPGVVGPPVETRFGFHLLLVTARQPAVSLTYEEVAEEVRQRCRDELERKNIDTLMTDLLQRAKVEILDPQLSKISL